MADRRRSRATALKVLKELIALPGTWDDLKTWAVIGAPPVVLMFDEVRQWFMAHPDDALRTIGIGWPSFWLVVFRVRGAWKRATYLAPFYDYTRYVAVRDDTLFGTADFSSRHASRTEVVRAPTVSGGYLAIAVPAYTARPEGVLITDFVPENLVEVFERLPGTVLIGEIDYAVWHSTKRFNNAISRRKITIVQPKPPSAKPVE